jgi:hypothetical protein
VPNADLLSKVVPVSTLNNVIAVVVVILLLSLVVQSIQGLLKKLLAIKSQQLEDSLVDLFEHVIGNAPVKAAKIVGRDGLVRNSPVLRMLFRRKHLKELASKPTQDVMDAIRLQFQRMGRISQGGTWMLDSLSREDLLKVLARIAPTTFVPSFLTNVQKVCDQITEIKKVLAALDTAAWPGEASAAYARLQDSLAPLLRDYATITTGGTVNVGVLIGDVVGFGQQAYTGTLTTLGEVQAKVAAAQAAAGGAGKNAALDQAAASLQQLAAEISKLRNLVDQELAPLHAKLGEVNTWFDTVMQSFTERYARGMKTWAVVISTVVVICLNANVFKIYDAVSGNEVLRQNLLTEGAKLVDQPAKPASTDTTATTTAATTTPAQLKADTQKTNDLVQRYTELGFQPITFEAVKEWWTSVSSGTDTGGHTWLDRRAGDVRTLVGWLIMVLLLSLGAPFWEDALESLFGVKNLIRQQSGTKNVEEQSGAGNPKA